MDKFAILGAVAISAASGLAQRGPMTSARFEEQLEEAGATVDVQIVPRCIH